MLEYTTTDEMALHYARAHQLRAAANRDMLRALARFFLSVFVKQKRPRIPAQPQSC